MVGTWKRSLTTTAVRIAVQPLVPWGSADRERVGKAFEEYARFIGRTPQVRLP